MEIDKQMKPNLILISVFVYTATANNCQWYSQKRLTWPTHFHRLCLSAIGHYQGLCMLFLTTAHLTENTPRPAFKLVTCFVHCKINIRLVVGSQRGFSQARGRDQASLPATLLWIVGCCRRLLAAWGNRLCSNCKTENFGQSSIDAFL